MVRTAVLAAALNRKYVEEDLRREYSAPVYYGEDAFSGLHVMDDLASEDRREARLAEGCVVRKARAVAATAEAPEAAGERKVVVPPAPNIPQAPFWGVRTKKDFDLREVFRCDEPARKLNS